MENKQVMNAALAGSYLKNPQPIPVLLGAVVAYQQSDGSVKVLALKPVGMGPAEWSASLNINPKEWEKIYTRVPSGVLTEDEISVLADEMPVEIATNQLSIKNSTLTLNYVSHSAPPLSKKVTPYNTILMLTTYFKDHQNYWLRYFNKDIVADYGLGFTLKEGLSDY
ncbi:MAG: hypothetical protein OXC40_06990, partial [Proteobacteria bacterium]|nr:hypothetical protein [Pseudomonadota bacterium]